jgi:microcompartment protein CcmL/EutN
MALGLLEVYGFSTAIACADAAAKAAGVKVVAMDKNKPAGGDSVAVSLIMQIKLSGDVSAVETAVEAGAECAKKRGLFVASHVIARETEAALKMAALNDVGKDKINR